VVRATINAACQVDWPHDKLVVQVLDDSTVEETSRIIEEVCATWRHESSIRCYRLTRPNRIGYKAGNLQYHMKHVQGDFVAIFDSDHRCEPQYLRVAMAHFFQEDGTDKKNIGLVQTAWAYYNTHRSLLTEYDALSNDIHHVIQQPSLYHTFGFFGFNGTGGIWRTAAIEAAGGWHWDTVTEDADMSYLAYMHGYDFVYLRHFTQLLELPPTLPAHKQQKHRWIKGHMQVMRTRLWKVLRSPHAPVSLKIQAFFHMTGSLRVTSGMAVLLMVPVIEHMGLMTPVLIKLSIFPTLPLIINCLLAVYAKVPGSNGHYASFSSRTARMMVIPLYFILSTGMLLYTTRANFEGLISNDATFLTTPKDGKEVDDDSDGTTHQESSDDQDFNQETSQESAGNEDIEVGKEVIGHASPVQKKSNKCGCCNVFVDLLGLAIAGYFILFCVVSIQKSGHFLLENIYLLSAIGFICHGLALKDFKGKLCCHKHQHATQTSKCGQQSPVGSSSVIPVETSNIPAPVLAI